ncbi:hypothetical protein TSAR_016764 [Trichomalopsis sarcophagae]|uniref:Uncharacterized protein n=1 Tax=Trichomalopsis sarcophagae TaxID=543379 RepID=A0A232EZ03_9HYME|nr:hypothetical protein TSAR_016764 [Trichomalopsis sarcophagae]
MNSIERALRKPGDGRRLILLKPDIKSLRILIVLQYLITYLGFGHWKDECNEADELTVCYKRRGAYHCLAECQMELSCFFCKENGQKEEGCKHVAGFDGCITFRHALGMVKKKELKNIAKSGEVSDVS